MVLGGALEHNIGMVTTQAIPRGSAPRTKRQFDIKSRRELIDWPKIKAEFMADGSCHAVAPFLREMYGWDNAKIASGNVVRATSGWGREKAGLRQEVYDKSMTELREQEKFRAVTLLRAKLNILDHLTKRMDHIDDLKIREVLMILRVIKTELGEPNSVRSIAQPSPPVPQNELSTDFIERLIQDASR